MSTWLLNPNPNTVLCIVYVAVMFVVGLGRHRAERCAPEISRELEVPPAASGVLNVGYLVT
ncbi:hypothetical protein [Paenibacillus sp. ISL-20]|uniref:hypothetical protein n=1 Tax=Paenibacillus sp. ISL-20 TaxID=2819163 RepID=UPI001BE673A3|nr:hypothetical protein [Paenibacillus sp. ISL-20]